MGSEKRSQPGADARDRAANQRDESADARDKAARARDEAADERDAAARAREEVERSNQRLEARRLGSGGQRPEEDGGEETGSEEAAGEARGGETGAQEPADREAFREFLTRALDYQTAVAADRRAAAQDRQAAAEDRRAAARDRELASWARQQAQVEAAQVAPEGTMRAETPEPAGGREPLVPGPEIDLDVALRAATSRQAEALESAQHAAELAREVAGTEERLAATLREPNWQAEPQAYARRLALAEEASQGARTATERGERLNVLTKRAAEHLEMATVRVLLSHAATAFGELARAERSIASAMRLLATHETGDVAAEHRREAVEASAAAERAFLRAEELHRMETATHESAPEEASPDSPGPETHD